MSRFPPPPPREDPIPLSSLPPKTDIEQNEQKNEQKIAQNDDDDQSDSDYSDSDNERDYLTEQYLRDKNALFNKEMVEVVDEIDTSTVTAKNIISLVLRNDIPYIQRRIITLLAKAVAEQSLELKVERTHGVENTSMLDKKKLNFEQSDQNSPDFSCQVNVISKSDFIKRQNDKRSGYLGTPLRDIKDNFNAELYFNSIDKMYALRPGKPVVKSFSVKDLKKIQQNSGGNNDENNDENNEEKNHRREKKLEKKLKIEQDVKKNVYREDLSELREKYNHEKGKNELIDQNDPGTQKNTQNTQKSTDPLLEFLPDPETDQTPSTELTTPRELSEYERIQLEVSNRRNEKQFEGGRKRSQETFLMPSGLGLLPPNTDFGDINELIKHGTSEMCLGDWFEASVTGLPVGHIFLHSTVTQSTHQLMINALSPLPTLIIYCADAQSLGRGRSQNSWVSPPGCLMYNFSIKVQNTAFLPFIQYYSSWLHVKSIYNALEHSCSCSECKLKPFNKIYTIHDKKKLNKIIQNAKKNVSEYEKNLAKNNLLNKKTPREPCMGRIEVRIKWPNDLYINGKKISGTLLSSVCDMSPDGRTVFTAHVGTGLNISNGGANGKVDFKEQHGEFLTINDAILAAYQEQLRFNKDILEPEKSGKNGDQNDQNDQNGSDHDSSDHDNDGKPLPALLDDDDMDLLLLQEEADQQQFKRRVELVELQKKQDKIKKIDKLKKKIENRKLDRDIKNRQKLERGEEIDQIGDINELDQRDLNELKRLEEGDGNNDGDNDGDDSDDDDDDDEDNIENNLDEKNNNINPKKEEKRIEKLFLRPDDLFLLTREIVLASITLTLSISLPHFNQFGFLPFENEYYKWWLHQDQIVNVLAEENDDKSNNGQKIEKNKGIFKINGIDPQNGYLTAKNVQSGEIVELHPETHSFDINSLTVRPKKPAIPAPSVQSE